MNNQTDRNRPPSILFGSYTYWFFLASLLILGWLVNNDLENSRHLPHALGVQANGWVWALLGIAHTLTRRASNSGAISAYEQIRKQKFDIDPTGFVEAGGSDAAFWFGLLGLILTVLAFSIIPTQLFGWARPVVVLVVSVFTGSILSRLIAGAVFRARFVAHQPHTFPSVAPICIQTYFGQNRCHFRTHKDTKYCRWHLIIHEVKNKFGKTGKITPIGMIGSVSGLVIAFIALKYFEWNIAPISIGLVLFGIGGALWFFAEAFMTRDLPFSQMPLWAMFLALGFVLGTYRRFYCG